MSCYNKITKRRGDLKWKKTILQLQEWNIILEINCEKEFDNDYDEEAIKVMMKTFGKVGYVANSSRTVAKGTKSAGRIYDKVGDKFFVRVCFVTGGSVIAEVVNKDVKIHKSNRKIRK